MLEARTADIRVEAVPVSDEIRRQGRTRRAVSASMVAGASKAIHLLIPLLTTPITFAYLGPVKFGAWAAVSSTIGMMSFADLGISHGLLTKVSQCLGRDDADGAARYVSSAYALLAAVALAIGLVYAVVFQHVPWFRLFNTPASLGSEMRDLVTVLLLWFASNLVLGVVLRTQMACQEVAVAHGWQLAGSIASTAATLFAVSVHAPVAVLALAAVGPASVASLVNTVVFFGWKHRELTPSLRHIDRKATRDLLAIGMAFVGLNVLTVISFQVDNLLVAHLFGVASVANFSLIGRIASLLNTVPTIAFLPFWSAFGEALSRGDSEWVEKNSRMLAKWCVGLTALAAVLLVALGDRVGKMFLGDSFHAPIELLIVFGIWSILLAFAGPRFMVLNGAGVVSSQVKMFLIFTPISLAMKVLLAHLMGVQGIIWGAVLPYAAIVLPMVYKRSRQVMRATVQVSGR